MATVTDLATLRQNVFEYTRLMLGDEIVDVELSNSHYNMALDRALRVFRQRTDNSLEESYGFLTLVKEQQEYILDDNVIEVRQVFRRGIGSGADGTSTQFEPFEAAYVNTYLMQSGRMGGLATYEMFNQYQELSARMFGGYMNFTWEPSTKKLTLVRNVKGDGETLLLWLYNKKPDSTLLQDTHILPWMEKYTLATCKIMLGEARGKFSTIVGPGGGTTLNGDALKAEGQQMIDECMEEIRQYEVGNDPLMWIQG